MTLTVDSDHAVRLAGVTYRELDEARAEAALLARQRDHLLEEAMDLTIYLRQVIEERGAPAGES